VLLEVVDPVCLLNPCSHLDGCLAPSQKSPLLCRQSPVGVGTCTDIRRFLMLISDPVFVDQGLLLLDICYVIVLHFLHVNLNFRVMTNLHFSFPKCGQYKQLFRKSFLLFHNFSCHHHFFLNSSTRVPRRKISQLLPQAITAKCFCCVCGSQV
jgi:hypothetical protein